MLSTRGIEGFGVSWPGMNPMTTPRLCVWIEPGPDGESVLQRCTVEEAIAVQRAVARAANFCYVDDHEALEDFLVTNWAWITYLPCQ